MSTSQATSKTIADLSDGAYRVWAMSMPHADRDGRLPSDLEELAAMAFPRLIVSGLWTMAVVEERVREIEASGLWEKGDGFYAIAKFKEHQQGMRYERETESKWSNSGSTPDLVRTNSGPTPDLVRTHSGSSPAQVQGQVQDQDQEEAQERTRARKSEERAENEPKPPPPSGARLQEWAATRPQVLADFRAALSREEWEPSRIDESAAREASGLLSSLKDRRAQFTKALAVLDEDGRAHPHKLADMIQVLRNGDHERKRTPMDHYAALDRKMTEDTEKILAERRSWAKG